MYSSQVFCFDCNISLIFVYWELWDKSHFIHIEDMFSPVCSTNLTFQGNDFYVNHRCHPIRAFEFHCLISLASTNASSFPTHGSSCWRCQACMLQNDNTVLVGAFFFSFFFNVAMIYMLAFFYKVIARHTLVKAMNSVSTSVLRDN